MQIKSVEALEGANVYSSKPVIRVFLRLGTWTGVYTNEIQGFVDNLLGLIPTLNEHFCSRGKPGGFVERMREGTLLGHVVEHVALELMSLAGHDVIYGKTLGTDEPDLYEIVMQYECREGAIQAANSSVKIVNSILQGQKVLIESELAEIQRVTALAELGPSTKAIVEECERREIPVMRLGSNSLLQLGYGKNQKRVAATITAETGCIGVDIAGNKTLTKQLLTETGIPVPIGQVAKTEEEALAFAQKLGSPVAVKPYNGNQGKGVALNLTGEAEIRAAFNIASQYSSEVIIEKYISGKHYRLTVVGNRLVAAAERISACVTGDGTRNIRELIEQVNSDPQRGEEHELPLTKIRIDQPVILTLARQGYSLETVPAEGETVYLRDNANLSTGGYAVDVTDQVHQTQAEIALRAAKIVGLDVAGIDLVTDDISCPFEPETSAIIEVNAAPGIRMHLYPAQGKPRNVAKAIVDHLFPTGLPSRIPIISVTGTNGKTTTTRMIAHVLRQRGLKVGMTNSDGVWIGEKQIVAGDTTGPNSARLILRDPEVDVAVLETARGGILRAGLGYDFADIAVITNISEDHFGQYGIESLADLAHVKSVVAEAVGRHSCVVLNADDPYVNKMATHTKGKVIFFSAIPENPLVKQYLGTGGTAVFIKRGRIIIAVGNQVFRVGNVKGFPATLDGRAAHNVQNLLAAVAASWALGFSSEDISKYLSDFSCSLLDNPGRLNLFEVNGFKVMIDYGHNAAGIMETVAAAKKLNPKRLVGVITVPGDRPVESIERVGKLAGKGFDYLFIKEDQDLRGRQVGEIAAVIRQGAIQAGLPTQKIKTILPEVEAFGTALEFARPGDLVVIFYEKLAPILKRLNAYLEEHPGKMGETKTLDKVVL
ncbi:MAG TPA: cyanophycin synthetase [Desulfobacteria bacterium]|nr:cyanophycin synthetase [Desulfobacteria bacterium]